MTEYSQTGGVHEVLSPKNPQEVGASQPLSDFEKNLTPNEYPGAIGAAFFCWNSRTP